MSQPQLSPEEQARVMQMVSLLRNQSQAPTLEGMAASGQATPEEVKQLINLGTLDEQGALLQQQMGMAEQLRGVGPGKHVTGLGGALGGLNSAVSNIGGAMMQKKLQEQQAALLAQKNAGRGLYGEILTRPSGQSAPVAPAQPPSTTPYLDYAGLSNLFGMR